jgi:hypothetical protein
VKNADTIATLDVYKGRRSLDANSYNPPGLLELGTTRYWRIDEVGDGNTWKGDVWSFSVREYTVVDDMESYCKEYGCGDEIYQTWIDGTMGNGTGSWLDLALAAEDPVHGGEKSMYFNYDNADFWDYDLEYYSEACRTLADPCDWTVYGIKALVLYFYGDPGNAAGATEQLYLGLEDSSGADSYADVNYPDMNDITEQQWHEWNINLQHFSDAGVDLRDVKKIYIGFGIRGNPNPGGIPGGLGAVFFDDIRLYSRRCIPDFASAADLTDDCVVGAEDFAVLGSQWRQSSGSPSADIAPQPPDGVVDWLDLAVLANGWLEESLWP